MTPIQKAYTLGQHLAKVAFEKIAEEAMPTLASNEAVTLRQGTPVPGVDASMQVEYSPEMRKKMEDAVMRYIQRLAMEQNAAGVPLQGAKTGEAALGDPNFWGGGTPSPEEAAPPAPQSAEEAIQLLPAGTFQGAQIKIQPDGIRNTTVKVTPDVVGQPDGLAAVFQAEPTAKVEISQPEQQVAGGEQPPMPPEGTPMDPNMAGAPAEEMPPPA